MTFQYILLGLFCAAAVLTPLLIKKERALEAGVVATVLLAIGVHSEFTEISRAIVLACTSLALLIGIIRFPRPVYAKSPFAVYAFGAVFAVLSIVHAASVPAMIIYLLLGTTICLLAAAASRLGQQRNRVLAVIAASVIVSQFVVSVADVFFKVSNPWPRRDGVTFRQVGLNNLLTDLGGRAMGTTGFSITLGLVIALCIVACFYLAGTYRKYWFVWSALAAIGVATIFLSGTRTALVMLLAAGGVWALRSFKLSHSAFYILLGGIAVGLFESLRIAVLEWTGLGGQLEQTASYQHRTGVFASAVNLLDRDVSSLFFGDGPGYVAEALSSGVVTGYGRISVFDNDYLRILASYGLVLLIAFVVMLARGIFNRDIYVSMSATAIAVGAFAYDITTWFSLLVFMVFVLASAQPRESKPAEVDEDEQEVSEPVEARPTSLQGKYARQLPVQARL
ncbi:O-antigen ligase family protein [Pseudoclavibacter helvolus]|uniref:O-antigen ligase n=1 Tax=Pseudoclavibacter helvolus TaxID=255205 RepID=A0A7W4UPW8_9MICO|nr:O-antigen ligase family protein [Pseudoclavibacter helvolus]MBB2958447.1 O-antigen ligase [Pseudoclavibacter helvolus]